MRSVSKQMLIENSRHRGCEADAVFARVDADELCEVIDALESKVSWTLDGAGDFEAVKNMYFQFEDEFDLIGNCGQPLPKVKIVRAGDSVDVISKRIYKPAVNLAA